MEDETITVEEILSQYDDADKELSQDDGED